MPRITRRARVAILAFGLLTSSASSLHAVVDGCAVVLRTPTGFLAVRAGPGQSNREIHRLYPGQIIVTNHISDGPYAGKWWRISGFMQSIGDSEQPLQGWVYSRYLTPANC